jgi:DNA-binding IclR family transcriptional regulator
MKPKYNFIQSLGRGLSILEQFSQGTRSLGITAIANRVGLPKSTCFGLLHTLQGLGYIQQDRETGQYSLGVKAFELGQAYITGVDLRSLSRPSLEQIVEKYQETVHLAISEGQRAVYIDNVEASHAVTVTSRVGKECKLHCTAAGKVLLAYMADEDRDEVISRGLERFTTQTITDPQRLIDHLAQIREEGYAIDHQERNSGLRCVGAPVFNARGQAIAAISISGPNSRVTREKAAELGPVMRLAGLEISRKLGYAP